MVSSLNHLLNTIEKNDPKADLDIVRLAYNYARDAHGKQKRKTGEDYIEHSLATAQKLADMKMSIAMIVAGILHDVPEDTNRSIDDVQKEFGKEVAGLVAGITKLGQVKYRGVERYLENVRKMFVAMAKDLRVIVIKFADRLHNLKTLDVLPRNKQLRIALETFEIYAPIADRLGMGELKGELEDLSFKYLSPDEYAWIERLLNEKLPKKEKYLEKIIKKVKSELKKSGIEYISVHGRQKHIYSLYRKLIKYHNDFSKIHDIIACRIIVKTVSECYSVLGIIHKNWTPLKGRIKDYIAQPKPNNYQSLHTTVFADDGEIVEFQIRTEKMHQEAEYGVAAHWAYSDHKRGTKYLSRKPSFASRKELKWIGDLTKWRKGVKENQQLLEDLKIEVFQSRIFVFTPKGDVIDLPEGATPVDFAYHIHTDVGNKCTGALVNEQMASLDTKLKSGDVVEIIVDKNRKAPSPDWLKFVTTRMAKSHIRQKLKKQKKTIGRLLGGK